MQNASRQRAASVITASAIAVASMLGAVEESAAQDIGDRSNLAFIGFDARQDAHYPYLGLIHHFSGNVLDDGLLFRVGGYRADYQYTTGASYDGTATSVDAMVGYQKNAGSYVMRGFIGVEHSDHDISPANPADANSGADTGVKVQGEIETDFAARNYFGLIAMYGSAKESYWARGRLGYNFSGNIVGGEAFLTGDQEFNERRLGAFVMMTNMAPMTFTLSGGYSNSGDSRGGTSGYVTAELAVLF